MKRAKSPSKRNSEDDDDDDSPYGSPSIKRTCLPSSSVPLPRVPGEAKSVFAALDGGDPNASLAVLQILLEELKVIPAYFKDAKILLDMQELIMHLHGCSLNGAKMRIKKIKKDQKSSLILDKYHVPGSCGHPKVAMELRHVLEYVLAQKGEVASGIRRSLLSIATCILSGDRSVVPTIHAIIDNIRDETTVTSTTSVPNNAQVSREELLRAHLFAHYRQAVPHQRASISQDDNYDQQLRMQVLEDNVDFDLLDAFTKRIDRELPKEALDDDVRFVYCIRVRGTNRVKIGFSKDPHQRLATLQTAHADLLDLELVIKTRDYRTLERELHHKHRGRRIRGEWFAFDESFDFSANIYKKK